MEAAENSHNTSEPSQDSANADAVVPTSLGLSTVVASLTKTWSTQSFKETRLFVTRRFP